MNVLTHTSMCVTQNMGHVIILLVVMIVSAILASLVMVLCAQVRCVGAAVL